MQVDVKPHRETSSDGHTMITFDLILKDPKTGKKERRKAAAFKPLDEKTLYKVVNPQRHLFIKHNGYAIAHDLLTAAKKNYSIETVRIIERQKKSVKRKLEAPLKKWFDEGKKINYDGYERQIVLPLNHMDDISPKINPSTKKNIDGKDDREAIT